MKRLLVLILLLLSFTSYAQFNGNGTFHADTLEGYYNPGYKLYIAKISQSDTSAPTATVLVNTIGEVTYSYISTGLYGISGPFTANTIGSLTLNMADGITQLFTSVFYTGINSMQINIINNTTAVDGSLIVGDNILEIRVYP